MVKFNFHIDEEDVVYDRRTLWYNPHLERYDEGEPLPPETLSHCGYEGRHGAEMLEPNLVSSRLVFGDQSVPRHDWHSPVIDIDFPIRAVQSSTPGHFHLYLDGIMLRWDKYEALLKALAEAGIIEQGYLENAIRRRMTMVRLPGAQKERSSGVPKQRDWPDETGPRRCGST